MGLVLACVVRILHDDWSIRLGENRTDGVRQHLAAMLRQEAHASLTVDDGSDSNPKGSLLLDGATLKIRDRSANLGFNMNCKNNISSRKNK